MNKQKDIKKILEDDGFKIVNQAVLPDKALDMAALQEAEKAQDYLNLLKKKSEREHAPAQAHAEKVPDRKSELASIKSDEFDIPTIVGNLNWHMNRISENVIGRKEIIRQAIFAILTGEHMLLLSRTGMAKSYLADYIFKTFEGARIFSSQASKDQTPDNYFGPYNIEEFKKGRIPSQHHGLHHRGQPGFPGRVLRRKRRRTPLPPDGIERAEVHQRVRADRHRRAHGDRHGELHADERGHRGRASTGSPTSRSFRKTPTCTTSS